MSKITDKLHNALLTIANGSDVDVNPDSINKLILMGFIKYQFGNEWLLSTEARAYLRNNDYPNSD